MPLPPLPRRNDPERIPLRFKLGLSLLLLAVGGFAGAMAYRATSPRSTSEIKAPVVAGLCAVVLLMLWCPPVARVLGRLFGRR